MFPSHCMPRKELMLNDDAGRPASAGSCSRLCVTEGLHLRLVYTAQGVSLQVLLWHSDQRAGANESGVHKSSAESRRRDLPCPRGRFMAQVLSLRRALGSPSKCQPRPVAPPSPALSLQRIDAFEQAQHLKAWCVPAPHWRVLGNAGNAAAALLTVLLHEPRFAASAVRAAYSRRVFLTRSHSGGRFVRRNSPTTRLHVRLRRFRTAIIAGAHTCRRVRR